MKLKRMITLTLSSALALLLVLMPSILGAKEKPIPLPIEQGKTHLPKSAAKCLESAGKTFEVVATAKEKDKTFYYLHVWLYGSEDNFESWYALIQTNSLGCQRLKGVQSGLKPISSFMTTPTARRLELERYRREIARAGGRQAFEQQLNQKLSPPPRSAYSGVPIYLSSEQVWALQQLGIRFPIPTSFYNQVNRLQENPDETVFTRVNCDRPSGYDLSHAQPCPI